MIFPDLSADFRTGGNDNQNARALINYAVYYHMGRKYNIDKLETLYNSFNGIIDDKQYEYIFKSTGKVSKTKYRKYKLGRTKLKQLHGEFLQINLGATARVSNPEAVTKKMKELSMMQALAQFKPDIEALRQGGSDVFPGVTLPNEDDVTLRPENFKTTNEIITQEIINEKLRTESLQTKFYYNWVDQTIASMCYGKNERNHNGIDTYRPINARYALFIEMDDDPFIKRSPFKGELRYMFEYEIYRLMPDLTRDDRERIRAMRGTIDDIARNRLLNIQGHEILYPVYFLEWVALEPIYCKVTPAKGSDVPYRNYISMDYYNENIKDIKQDVKAGKYEIIKEWRGNLFTGNRIGRMVYTNIGPETDFVMSRDQTGKKWPTSNYHGMLYDTIDGERVSMQQIITDLEDVYDHIRWLINKELGKIKGKILAWDEANKPRGVSMIDIYHQLSEDGTIIFNSSAEGNESNRDSMIELFVKEFDIGPSQGLSTLIEMARDVEMTMDRITGMNSDRIGISAASQTATSNQNNIQASRSMTYSMFYFFQEYIKEVLAHLVDKTRINLTKIGADGRRFVYSDEQKAYLMATEDYADEDYAFYISDGKREFDIQQKLEQWFTADVTSGKLSSKDIAKYYMQDNFNKAIQVLEKAWTTANAFEMSKSQQAGQVQTQIEQSKEQSKTASQREAEQAKLDQISLQTEGQKEVEQIKQEGKSAVESQKGVNKIADTHTQNMYNNEGDQNMFNE